MAVQYKHKPQEAVKCHRECHSQSRCPIYKLKQSRRVHCVVFLCQYEYSTVKICVSQLLGEPEKIVGINLTWSSILTKGAKKISCPIIFTPSPNSWRGHEISAVSRLIFHDFFISQPSAEISPFQLSFVP